MIDTITAFAGIKSAHSMIMSAVKIGKDVSSLSSAVAKYAKGEAALQAQSECKKNAVCSKLGGVEADAIDIAQPLPSKEISFIFLFSSSSKKI